MKTTLTSLLTLLLLTAAAAAQPQISYILPDIGAAGMNTYVEIVAPVTAIGTFGPTATSQFVNSNNGSETVGIGPVNIADTARIVVGPIIVSWEGRLISTQIFVKRGAANGTVPLKVTVGGSSANVDFEIVTPQVLGAAGTISGGGVLGSGGSFGTRSKRGAMIVDQLILNGGTYTISTNDPDGATGGNQGYLPTVIIVKRTLALVSGASINVNAAASNAGPGGGGGGGRYCDRTFLGDGGPGNDGGNGYTAGGAGGRNSSFGGGSSYKNVGSGSGPTAGASLNGVLAGHHLDCNKYESSGGGTGHPFGGSGLGPCFPTTGQYGGGSAANDNTGGGGAGNASNGANGTGSNAGTNGGNITGNKHGVPVAGGSGGASGNPRSGAGSGVCSGDGGGGGGALVIYSQELFNNSGAALAARGAAGGTGSGTTNGGAGSGGYIEMGAKVLSSAGGVGGDVAAGAGANGGGAGGQGRGRYDGFVNNVPGFTGAGTTYVGPTIDTLSYVQTKTFALSGSKGADAVQIWMRSDATVWQLQPAPTIVGSLWSLVVTVPNSGNYYFVAMQVVAGPSGTQYRNEPGWVLSQAAANMVRVDLIAKISVNRTSIAFKDVLCSETIVDSIKVWNTGDDTLRVTPTLKNGIDFALAGPLGPFVVAPGGNDTVIVRVRFRPTTPGAKTDSLILTNNDPRAGKNPTTIKLTGRKANIIQTLSKRSLDFGDICKDSLSTALSTIFSQAGDTSGSIKSITRLGSGPAVFTITQPLAASLPLTLASGATADIRVTFRPNAAAVFVDSFRILAGPCDTPFVFVVRGRGMVTSATVTPNPVDFGDVPINQVATQPVTVTNTGSGPATIISATITGTGVPLTAIDVSALTGKTIPAGGSITQNVSVTPTAAGAITGTLCLVFGPLCPDTVCADITGRCTTALLILSDTSIVLTADSCSDTPPAVTGTFTLYNKGTATVRIDSAGAAARLVTVAPSPTLPHDLAPGDSIVFTVTWQPGSAGTERIQIGTQSADPTQRLLRVDVTMRREISKIIMQTNSGAALPSIIDFGNVFDCSSTASYTFTIRNAGTLAETLTGGFVDGRAFSLSPGSPIGVPVGANGGVTITFSTSTPGIYNDTLVLRDAHCNREFRIPVTAVRAGISFTVTGFAFGTTNIGITKSGTASITNTSSTPNNVKLHVADATIQPAGTPFAIVPPTGLPKSIAPGEAATVEVSFSPTAQVTSNATICFHIDSPCDTTICVPLSGSGVTSSVLVRVGSLNFGTHFICELDSLNFFIINSATTLALAVDSIRIVGADAAAFELAKPATLPLSITPQDSVEALVRFIPARAASDGLKQATLEIYTSDPVQPIVRVNLIGERRKQSLATPTQLSFGAVEVGTSALDTLTLENRTAAPMQISSLTLGAPFVIVSPAVPTTIGPFDSIKVIVRFTPTDTVPYNGTLVAYETSPCTDSTMIPVDGRGKITPVGRAEIEVLSTLTGKPGDRIAIPIVLRSGNLLSASGATTFRARLRFDKTLLYPLRARVRGQALTKPVAGLAAADTAWIISSVIDGEDRVVTAQFTHDPLPDAAPDTLGFIDAQVMLGDTLVTPITIDTLYFTDGTVNATTTDGFFTLEGICITGGNRLISTKPGFGIKRVAPNPFNAATMIGFTTVEQGPTTLVIHDMLGREVARLIDRESLAPGDHLTPWDAGSAPTGVYIALLISPTERSQWQLVLAK